MKIVQCDTIVIKKSIRIDNYIYINIHLNGLQLILFIYYGNIIIIGVQKIKKTKKDLKIINLLIIIIVTFLLIFPITIFNVNSLQNYSNSNRKIVTKLTKEVDIPAGKDYCIIYNSQNLTLDGEINPIAHGLSSKIKNAIAKSPDWIQRDLTRQFKNIENPEEYADLILKSSKKYTDEIAFTIAFSPLGEVPQAELIWDNAYFIYEIDKIVQYADIIDYNNHNGNYYSTIRYNIIEKGIKKQLEYPKEIYYWYVVHPELLGENIEYIYGRFWRDYLINHNDLGYPLLKEKISNIYYLWDCESYSQFDNRLWKKSINEHPTAIEAISYWIGKTVKYLAIGDRPNQPNIIAHEHNGFCGEIQRIAVAAQRSALIPSIGACNIGEDHVWMEFYEREWHQNDNWWADTGGTVDIPNIYEDGWGKDMSAIYTINGDGSINEVTSTYIHPKNRVIVKFIVKDMFMNPVDGAIITVLVKGIKDITWYKNKFWQTVEKIWNNMPEFIKGKIIQTIYNKTKNRLEEIPNVIDGITKTIWKYSNPNGECIFKLGKNDEYIFLIQQPNLNLSWPFSTHSTIRTITDTKNITYNIFFSDLSNRIQRHNINEINEGDCHLNIVFDTKSYQLQKNIKSKNIGIYNYKGNIDFFILDKENFIKYNGGRKFNCFHYVEDKKTNFNLSINETDLYLVFRNHYYHTNVVLNFSIQVETYSDTDHVQINIPDLNIFDHPIINAGDKIMISGIASENINLHINNETIKISTIENKWSYLWNTSDYITGEYLINAECGIAQDNLTISIIDENPPTLVIKQPNDGSIFEGGSINITGESWDNLRIDRIEVALDDSNFKKAYGKENWFIEWDINGLDIGKHTIFLRLFDIAGKITIDNITIVINESELDYRPDIIDFYHIPDNPTNKSNIILYANVTSNSPFLVKKVVLYIDNGKEIYTNDMYYYGDNPIQKRHEEDPLQNISNGPIYGYDLGEFESGETLNYWIEAYDIANNSIKSYEKSIYIG